MRAEAAATRLLTPAAADIRDAEKGMTEAAEDEMMLGTPVSPRGEESG